MLAGDPQTPQRESDASSQGMYHRSANAINVVKLSIARSPLGSNRHRSVHFTGYLAPPEDHTTSSPPCRRFNPGLTAFTLCSTCHHDQPYPAGYNTTIAILLGAYCVGTFVFA